MSEPRIDEIVRELRETAPPAPQHLRERVRALPEPAPRRRMRIGWRPALAAAVAGAVALALGAAALDGLTGDSGGSERSAVQRDAPAAKAQAARDRGALLSGIESARRARQGAITPSSRLQDYDAVLRLRVRDSDDLSSAMQRAIRDTRRLGGYIVSARYAQAAQSDGSLVVRVPIGSVQDAIASLSNLGTILEQRISLQDLQPQADRLDKAISVRRDRIAELVAKREREGLSAAERAELVAQRAELERLTRSRAAVLREGRFAQVSLGLTTRKAAEKKDDASPGAFRTFLDDTGAIFTKEAIVLLYALVIVGPFALLAALALLGERARRRRANDDLLERVGQTG
jgi:Domain of unknown function (DUF4349)